MPDSVSIFGGHATTARVCRQHGLTLFYHLGKRDAPLNRTLYSQSPQARARMWRCGDCGMMGKLPPWVSSDRDGWEL